MLENVIYELYGTGTVFIAGDFNAHIGSFGGTRSIDKVNCRGRRLSKTMGEFDLISLNSQVGCTGPIETFYINGGLVRTTTDHILVPRNYASFILHIAVIPDCCKNMSYHLPISCSINVDLVTKVPNLSMKQLCWKNVKYGNVLQKYQNALGTALHNDPVFSSEAITPNAIEQLVDHTVSHLKITADKTIPTRVFKPVRKHYWNPTLTSLNREVKTCWRKWLYEGKPRDNNNQFFKDYKKAKYNFRKAQRQAIHEDEVNDFVKLERQHDIERSKFYNRISKLKKPKRVNNGEVLEIDGNRVSNNSEVLDVWRQHYCNLYTPKDNPNFDNDFKKFVENKLVQFHTDSYGNDDPLDNPFQFDEVVDVCSKLPNGKASGPDQLSYEHVKFGGNLLFEVLTKIFNAVRELEYVTGAWSTGNIFSLFKGGKKNRFNKENYRGITLLNVVGKIFERLILNRWIPKFETMGIPNNYQFAYQADKSCTLASFVLQETINHNVERGSKVYCCFLDSSKAFAGFRMVGRFVL